MTFLIDGYNLMHAAGLLGPGPARPGLEAVRTRFLDWLADGSDGRPDTLRVVFDAEKGLGASPESDHRGVRVRFAFRRTADDEIEDLLAAESRPARVAVVSNDSRVREAGRRRGCVVRTCEEFTDWLLAGTPLPAKPPRPPGNDKPVPAATPDEIAAWLAAFNSPTPKPRKP